MSDFPGQREFGERSPGKTETDITFTVSVSTFQATNILLNHPMEDLYFY